ncbi:MAG TPA: hypothetical protein VFD00_11260 [Thermoclostridium sp.]|nr:hypothetical protein [Thermoclostridium sp.]
MDVWNDWYSVVSLDEAVIMKNLVIVISHYFIKCEIRGWVRQEGFWSLSITPLHRATSAARVKGSAGSVQWRRA